MARGVFMAIGKAEKRGNLVFVRDDEGQLRFVRIGDVHAQSGRAVSIERAGRITTFDETGREIEQARWVDETMADAPAPLLRAAGAR
jgi:hypothetical protein